MDIVQRFTIVLLVACGALVAQPAWAQSGAAVTTPPIVRPKTLTCDPNAPDTTTSFEVGSQAWDALKYVDTIRPRLRDSWYSLIGTSSRMENACAVIDFTIRSDGGISALKLDTSTGDPPLDRAVIGGVLLASPFSSLPIEASPSGLRITMRFYYRCDVKRSRAVRPEIADRMTAPDDEPLSTDPAITSPSVIYSPNPERVPEVLANHNQQNDSKAVILEATVSSRGDVTAARVTSGMGNGFDEKALVAVFISKFRPAMKDGIPMRAEVATRVRFP